MAKNKIIYGNETLIDLTDDTVTPENLLSGATAHDRSGEAIQGIFEPTDEKVKIVETNTTGGYWAYPMWRPDMDSTGYGLANDGFRYYQKLHDNDAAYGRSLLQLGNPYSKDASDATEKANNKRGELRIYSEKDGYVTLYTQKNATSPGKNIYFPDKAGTVALDGDYLPITGGTVKASNGNGEIKVEGADNVTNYGSIKLVRNSQIVTIAPADGISAPRNIHLPNLSGTVVVGSDNYGKSISSQPVSNPETWAQFLDRLRDTLFDNTLRRNVIRFSSLDGISNLIFNCQRFVNTNTSVWTSTIFDGTLGPVTYFISFGSNSAALRKSVGGGQVLYNLSNDSTGDVTATIL